MSEPTAFISYLLIFSFLPFAFLGFTDVYPIVYLCIFAYMQSIIGPSCPSVRLSLHMSVLDNHLTFLDHSLCTWHLAILVLFQNNSSLPDYYNCYCFYHFRLTGTIPALAFPLFFAHQLYFYR